MGSDFHMDPPKAPKAKAKITVSIPVTIGGYTGQRDDWEEWERECKVTLNDDGTISLESADTQRTKITFDPDALRDALAIVRPKQPVYRSMDPLR